jgi:glutaredoxin-related protein
MPLVIFNTYNFDMLEFDHTKGRFDSLNVSDEYNVKDKMPKYFKSKVVSDNEVVFMGGCDIVEKDGQQEHVSSDKAFRILNGKIELLTSR